MVAADRTTSSPAPYAAADFLPPLQKMRTFWGRFTTCNSDVFVVLCEGPVEFASRQGSNWQVCHSWSCCCLLWHRSNCGDMMTEEAANLTEWSHWEWLWGGRRTCLPPPAAILNTVGKVLTQWKCIANWSIPSRPRSQKERCGAVTEMWAGAAPYCFVLKPPQYFELLKHICKHCRHNHEFSFWKMLFGFLNCWHLWTINSFELQREGPEMVLLVFMCYVYRVLQSG